MTYNRPGGKPQSHRQDGRVRQGAADKAATAARPARQVSTTTIP